MDRRIVTAVFLAALATGAASSRQPPPINAAQVDAVILAEMERQHIPGVAVAIVRAGTVVKAQGYGLANVEHQVPVTPDTIFQSGSLGKMFTAVAVMLQVEDGKLSLSDPIAKFFPGAPAAWTSITVRHLLTHTSGIPDYTDGAIDLRKDYTEEELAPMAYGLKLDFTPGEKWKYSNTGYLLLGIIIHKASGTFYGDVLAERVFKPFGMETTCVISQADIVPHRAAGYTLVKGELKNQEWVSPSLNTTADGALYCSVRVLIAWDDGVGAGRILRASSWASVFEPSGSTTARPSTTALAGAGCPRRSAGSSTRGAWQGFKTHYARFDRGPPVDRRAREPAAGQSGKDRRRHCRPDGSRARAWMLSRV
jgi:CubicO group peptidase (beta-lactamase class C family)